MRYIQRILWLFVVVVLCIVVGCDSSVKGNSGNSQSDRGDPTPTSSQVEAQKFVVCATGEGKLLTDIVAAFGKEKGVNSSVVQMSGTFDVLNAIRNPEASECNAIIVSASPWLDLNIPAGVLSDRISLMITQIVVGLTDEAVAKAKLSRSKGQNVITPTELMKLISGGTLKVAVPATSSNAGMSFLLLANSAFAGEPDALTKEQVEDPQIISQNKEVMSKVLVRGGSSELKSWFLANSREADGMVNYAGYIAQYNTDAARDTKARLLNVFYINPTYQADVPISFVVKKGDSPKNSEFYRQLVTKLLSADVQRSFHSDGYHPVSLELADGIGQAEILRPEWGFDSSLEENLAYFQIPDNSGLLAFVRDAYEAYRNANFVALVADYSLSMGREMGAEDTTPRYKRLYEALSFLLDDAQMAEVGLPYRNGENGDVVVMIPFSSRVIEMDVLPVATSPNGRSQILTWLKGSIPAGKTAIYAGINAALRRYQGQGAERTLDVLGCTIVVLTDGQVTVGSFQDMFAGIEGFVRERCTVYAIGIGEADARELSKLASAFNGQVFHYDGNSSALVALMRKAFGANR